MEETRECGKCHKHKTLTSENWKAQFRGGGLHVTSNCRVCSEHDRIRKQQKRKGNDPEKENVSADASTEPDMDDASEFLGVDPISLDAFRDTLGAASNIKVFCARVDISSLPNTEADDARSATDALAEIVWEKTGYRFLDVRRLTETGTVRTTTWAQKGKKASAKYTRNTMGVHIP
ncbi:hypothetical protein C8F04DRAFT_1183752 [Mycena alexandri]|uniref:Uncharacterized protein n=1 Tax=Mycena alexandri TaxID=1745969 RepID=A0AAD6SU63_9AGAR|nr:hypothetical protein C8F04DRAFT_1183752 [Mycena alexandri]